MKSLEDLAKSIRSRLSQIARQKKVAFKDIETEFLLERLVVRLVQDPQVSECIVFKGGYVALRVYGSERFTVDVDATIIKGDRDVLITKARELIESTSMNPQALPHFRRNKFLKFRLHFT